MRYFKYTIGDDYDIFVTNEDGSVERQLYSSNPRKILEKENYDENEVDFRLTMLSKTNRLWKEITEEEAFLEMV